MKKILLILMTILVLATFCACSDNLSNELKDGYYTAERIDFHPLNTWKEFVTIYVKNNKIVNIEYNAKNASGFIKSWDMKYMFDMRNLETYPSEYVREYAAKFLENYDTDNFLENYDTAVPYISGATDSHIQFKHLIEAVLIQAKNGDKTVAKVPYTIDEFSKEPTVKNWQNYQAIIDDPDYAYLFGN